MRHLEPVPAAAPAPPVRRWWWTVAWLLPAVLCAALIFYLSSLSHPLPALTSRVNDKLLHFVEYAALAVAVTWGLSHLMSLPAASRWAALFGALYGATDEFHQRFVPHRSADLADWAADAAGAALGALLTWLVLRRWRARASIDP